MCPLCHSRPSLSLPPVLFGDGHGSTVRAESVPVWRKGFNPAQAPSFFTLELPYVLAIGFLLFLSYRSLPWAVLKCPVTILVSFFYKSKCTAPTLQCLLG